METSVTEKGFSNEYHSLKHALINQEAPISHKDYFRKMLLLNQEERKTLIKYMDTYDPKMELHYNTKDSQLTLAVVDAFENANNSAKELFIDVVMEKCPEFFLIKKTA